MTKNSDGMKNEEFSFSSDIPNESALPSWFPLKTTAVFNTYWKFAAARQRVFFARFNGQPPPWTDDPIIKSYKFTNAYRASDRVSQYLIQKVIYSGSQAPRELFFRTMLFKFFNRIETWELLEAEFGTIDLKGYKFENYEKILSLAMESGEAIYSAAYIMPSGGKNSGFSRKHQMHLRLLEKMIADELPERLMESKNMRVAFELIRNYPTIGDFLAYQYVTDLNYGPMLDFSEMQFVCAGPGAKDGIRKCFSETAGLSEPEIIKLMAEKQEEEFQRLGIEFDTLWGRRLQLIDCQNLFCEVDKYSRVAHPEFTGLTGRTRIKQKFRATTAHLPYWFPPKWGINEKIAIDNRHVHDH